MYLLFSSLATSSSPDTLPPTITSVNALSSYVIRLAWAPVKATSPIRVYTVEYKPGHGGAWSRLPPTHLYTLTVGNLLPHTTYDLRVFASDHRGEGVPSPIISTTTPARGQRHMGVWSCITWGCGHVSRGGVVMCTRTFSYHHILY